MLSHNVYFSLKTPSPGARATLIGSCHEHLAGHPGVVFFAVGTLEPGLERPVNDLDFDVHLCMVFRSRADHDAYQVHPRHQRFISENLESWRRVRVFDSSVSESARS